LTQEFYCDTSNQKKQALYLLGKVGIINQTHKLPATLPGGEQQRAAIARALANDPAIITEDEPTGNLDPETKESVLQLFQDLAGEGTTAIHGDHHYADINAGR
jgi:putative ABC transport system ATP-binding protein